MTNHSRRISHASTHCADRYSAEFSAHSRKSFLCLPSKMFGMMSLTNQLMVHIGHLRVRACCCRSRRCGRCRCCGRRCVAVYLQREDPDLFDSILEFLLRLHQLSLQLSRLSFHDEWSGRTVDRNRAPLPCNTFFSAVQYLEPT